MLVTSINRFHNPVIFTEQEMDFSQNAFFTRVAVVRAKPLPAKQCEKEKKFYFAFIT
jgi:hypothetical protein